MTTKIKNILKEKNKITSFNKLKRLQKKEKQLLDINDNILTEKQIIKLDKDTTKLNKEISKIYVDLRNLLVKEGINIKTAHNFLMK